MNASQPSKDLPPSYPNQVRRRSSVASFVETYSDHENDFLLALAQEVLDDSSDDEDDSSWSVADGSDAGCSFSFEIDCPLLSKQVSFGDVTVYESLSEQAPGTDHSTETKQGASTKTTTISLLQHEIERLVRSPSPSSPARKRRDKTSPCKGWAMSKQQHDQLFGRCQGPPIEAAPRSTRKNDGIAQRSGSAGK